MSKLKEEIVALREDNKLKEGQIQGLERGMELCGNMHEKYSQVIIAEEGRK
jgi:hypothetical protein